MTVLPLFKSHFSIGKSILSLEKPTGKDSYPTSIFDLLKNNGLNRLVLVDESISGLLQASKVAEDNKIDLTYGIRFWVSQDAKQKNESILAQRARYIVFMKGPDAYENLLKMWTYAATDGFYYEPSIDFKTLGELWDDKKLKLAIPFYDSFLYLNNFESHLHVPDVSFTKDVTLFQESNDLIFDDHLSKKVQEYGSHSGYPILQTQSIYYKCEEDFLAYLAIRCLHNRTTIDCPNLNHMTSDKFNFKKWMANANV